MKPQLSSVPTNLPDPPYPPDTHVRGWKFQIDHERLLSSDTWALAQPDERPWLLMVWHTAWVQRPAGAFTDDRAVIAAKIGMPQKLFSAHADVLLRGFVRHSDGRLYHPVIVAQVIDWQERNRRERERVRAWRESSNTYVTRNKRVSTTPEPEPEPDKDVEANASCPKADASAPEPAAPCPYEEIWKLWCAMLPELRKPVSPSHWTDNRKARIRARWRDQLPDLDSWRECFDLVRASPFLMGNTTSPGRRPFQADLFWITKPENLLKLYENRYA